MRSLRNNPDFTSARNSTKRFLRLTLSLPVCSSSVAYSVQRRCLAPAGLRRTTVQPTLSHPFPPAASFSDHISCTYLRSANSHDRITKGAAPQNPEFAIYLRQTCQCLSLASPRRSSQLLMTSCVTAAPTCPRTPPPDGGGVDIDAEIQFLLRCKAKYAMEMIRMLDSVLLTRLYSLNDDDHQRRKSDASPLPPTPESHTSPVAYANITLQIDSRWHRRHCCPDADSNPPTRRP